MTRSKLHIHSKGSCPSTKPLWPDSQFVDFFKEFFLELGIFWMWVAGSNLTKDCFFGKKSNSVEGPTYPNPDNYGWTRVRPCLPHLVNNKLLYTFYTGCRRKHTKAAHILCTAAFSCKHYLNPRTGNYVDVDYSRGIVSRIDSFEKRIGDYRLSKVAFNIALPYTFINCFIEISTCKSYVLAKLDEKHGNPGILTCRHILLTGNPMILQDLLDDFLAY